MTLNQHAILMQPGKGSSYWFDRDLYTFKAVGEETGQAYALCEAIVAPRGGTPLHRHSHEDESFFIQEGALEFQLDEQTVVAGAGTFLYSPKGQLHQFTNTSDTPAKVLIWVTPAGFEKFIAEVGKTADTQVNPAPSLTPADLEKILTTAPKYGIEIIPPPSAQ